MLRYRAWTSRPHLPGHVYARVALIRRVQTLPTTPTNNPAPPPKDAPKHKLQLRPAPIKTPQSIPTPPPASTSHTPAPTVRTKDSISLTSLKETTTRDIADAEAHGILIPPPPGAGWAKSTLHKVIQLAKFYFRGVKLVYTRNGIARDIRRRVQAGGAPLERWEHRMLRTQSADIKRLLPFVLIALILEEVIPLIVIYAPGILPSTCILPSQRDRIREEATDKALALITSHGHVLGSLTRAATNGEMTQDSLSSQDLPKVMCGLLGLPTFGIDYLRIRRIRRHLTFVEKDDAFLAQDGVRSLSAQDLLQALQERGIITRGLDSTQQSQKLTWWLKSVSDKSDTIARRIYLVALLGSR